jgi:Rrf2 family protein
MVLAKPSKYAIVAMSYLAARETDRLVPIREISAAMDIPSPYVAKILTLLSHSGLLVARRGPNGGVRLSRPAAEIRLDQIVNVLEGPGNDNGCYLGLGDCDTQHPCPAHGAWRKGEARLKDALRSKTLEDVRRSRCGSLGEIDAGETAKQDSGISE